jgi:hypothetical protein
MEKLVEWSAGDLRLLVVRAPSMPQGDPPPPDPLRPGDQLPWLPPARTAGRLADGFAATDQAGELTLVWRRSAEPLLVGWRDEDGDPPEPEVLEVGSQPAILCAGTGRWMVLAVSRPDGQAWTVGGRCAREDLLRVAESLP